MSKLEQSNRSTPYSDELEEQVRKRIMELQTVNEELEAFSYSVSHDLRTPLRAITGYSTMLKEDYADKLDVEGNRILNNILQNTSLMSQLIDDLLIFSKMSRLEKLEVEIDMNVIVQKCIAEIFQTRDRKPYDFLVYPLIKCEGDASMLKQVWFNLIDNAVKYSSKNNKADIVIGCEEEGDMLRYFIVDNGVGFDMRYSDQLFTVFHRLHRQDEFEGTGLGLALAKRIISKHRGDITIESAPGQGTRVTFSIPKIIHEA